MEQVLAIRPFVPAKDFEASKRFYQSLGFVLTHDGADVALLKTGSFSFILQNFYVPAAADNCMVQMLVRDADAWWRAVAPHTLAAAYGVKPAIAPAMQSWGMKVGFIFDPSGVLWHVAEVPF